MGRIIALPAEIQRWHLADLAVLTYAIASDSKLIIYRVKRGFLWGMYRKRVRSFVAEKKETSRRLQSARRIPDMQ